MEIRASRPIDRSAIEALYLAAFPDVELLPIVRAPFATESRVLSLAGMIDAVLLVMSYSHVATLIRTKTLQHYSGRLQYRLTIKGKGSVARLSMKDTGSCAIPACDTSMFSVILNNKDVSVSIRAIRLNRLVNYQTIGKAPGKQSVYTKTKVF